jgi:hypothetical protein
MRIEHTVDGREDRAVIRIQGLRRDLRILHLTDSHMAEGDDRDPEAAEYVVRFRELFEQRTPGAVPAREVFADTLRKAAQQGIDATVMTGDMIHFPARAGLEAIQQGMDELAVPFLYALGNHDWHMPSVDWCEQTRDIYYPRFDPLTGGSPACQSMELDGVRLIALDNSSYQVSEAQLEFLRREIATGQPCLLYLHIPIWVESLTPATVDRWQAPIMLGVERGWTEEKMREWRVSEATATTRAFRDLLVSGDSENLAAIFCGHLHFPHTDEYRPGRFQYVTRAGFEGGHRMVDLTPA